MVGWRHLWLAAIVIAAVVVAATVVAVAAIIGACGLFCRFALCPPGAACAYAWAAEIPGTHIYVSCHFF